MKLSKLEAIRGFAALYVVLHHTFRDSIMLFGFDFSFLLRFGQEAVILFFLLSGFVIEYSHSLSKDKSFKTYFFKRFLRIYIPLICIFILNYIINVIRLESILSISFTQLVGNIFMLQDISNLKPNVLVSPFLGNSPLWSLSYEWWFYMLYFPLIHLVKKNIDVVVYSFSIVAAITYIFYPNFLNRELMYFIIWWQGTVLAKVYLKKGQIKFSDIKFHLLFFIIIIIILSFNVFIHFTNQSIGVSPILELRHFTFVLAVIIGALIWQKINWIGFQKLFGVFELFAPISYAIYISH